MYDDDVMIYQPKLDILIMINSSIYYFKHN